jgi:regulator of RNase E activity RraA
MNTAVQVGTVPVAPGATVIQDAAGVVVLPSGGPPPQDLLDTASAYATAEDNVLAELAAGVRLVDAYRHKRSILKRIRESRRGVIHERSTT